MRHECFKLASDVFVLDDDVPIPIALPRRGLIAALWIIDRSISG
jgi:hypothetical protein